VFRFRSGVAIVLSVCALIASTGIASAHAQYQSSTPAAGATLPAAPATVQVVWTQEINAVQFTITGPDGSNVVSGAPKIDLEQRHNASVATRDAGPGQYMVLWHNVSDEDGDPNDGSFVFTVAGTPPPTPAAPAPPAAPGAPVPPAAPAAPAAPAGAPASPAAPAAPAAPAGAPTSPAAPPACVDNGQVTSGQADFRVNTYCKRQAIREQYKGKINELIFNFDLGIGMGLESALKDAMGGGGDD
jgi:copper resistance protein C